VNVFSKIRDGLARTSRQVRTRLEAALAGRAPGGLRGTGVTAETVEAIEDALLAAGRSRRRATRGSS
jgi:hypothetical protein